MQTTALTTALECSDIEIGILLQLHSDARCRSERAVSLVSVPSALASFWEVPKGILFSPKEEDGGSYFVVLRNGSPLFCFKKKNPG